MAEPEVPLPPFEHIRHPYIESVTDRIHYVADLMAAAVWNERTSRRLQNQLGVVWDVSPSTIRNYSAEAGRSIRESIIERRSAVAQRAIDRLERIGGQDMKQNIVGLPGAIVHANELLLRATGYAEPEEDKQRPTTLIQIGQIVASPVFSSLINQPPPKQIIDAESTTNDAEDLGPSQDTHVVPNEGGGEPVV